jgi:predicted ATP-dependent protease
MDELRSAIPAAFESEDFRVRKRAIEEAAKKRQEDAFNELQEAAQARGIAVLRTPVGMMLAALRNDEVLPSEEFLRLPQEEQERIKADIQELQGRLEAILRQIPQWEREARGQLWQLSQDVTSSAVRHLLDELRGAYRDLPQALEHLDAMERDLIETAEQFGAGPMVQPSQPGAMRARDADRFRRYWVNLLVDHGDSQGAPVVYEDHPTFQNLVGRIEYLAQFGALVTDFNLIQAGALHRANDGYLGPSHHGRHPSGPRRTGRHRARGRVRRSDSCKGCLDPCGILGGSFCCRPAAHAAR